MANSDVLPNKLRPLSGDYVQQVYTSPCSTTHGPRRRVYSAALSSLPHAPCRHMSIVYEKAEVMVISGGQASGWNAVLRSRSFSNVWHQVWKNSQDKFSITISVPDVEILTMTGVGLVFSATTGKVAALCFILTILVYLQWNELELCTKQRQEKTKGHCSTLDIFGASHSIAE